VISQQALRGKADADLSTRPAASDASDIRILTNNGQAYNTAP